MKINVSLSVLLFCCFGYSQEVPKDGDIEKTSLTYVKCDLSFPIKANQHAGEIDTYTGEKEYWFLPDGISARIGFGVKPLDWINIGANLGIDWKGSKCLVVAPVFATLKICPKVESDTRIFIEPGFGRAFAFGKNDSGYFKKISIGAEDTDTGLGLYVELCQYGFSKNTAETIGSFCVGLTFRIH
ncbi:hypothetical protein [Flavobacterium sp.]|uniref:hypothetical protein n=1 Tax=Flavobacterium sp. TaxID=239 RepID=UPI0025CCD223|nr:hypothetical protein [Flavobacterium sp.]